MNFDRTDREILKYLQINSHISNRRLGEQVHLSAPAAAERVRRMEDAGIIEGYTVRLNPFEMGYKVEATVIVMLLRGKKNAFLKWIETEHEIVHVDEIPGKTDALLRVHASTMERFFSLVSRIHEYGETDCYIHMRKFKNSILLPDI